MFMAAGIIFVHLWNNVVPRKELSSVQVLQKIGVVYLAFASTFAVAYLSVFYVHLAVLTNAGPHDTIMTSAFQASLKVKFDGIARFDTF